MSGRRFSTDCAHAGEEPIATASRPAVMPIYQTSVYDFPDLDVVDSVWEGKQSGYIYGRYGLPNTSALESIVAKLEGGEAALASASGMASIMVAFATLLQAGDEVVVAQNSYGGTVSLSLKELPRFGITPVLITDIRPHALLSKLTDRTKALIVETISNPLWEVVDIPALAEVCRSKGVTLVVDNTSATPCLVRPLALGADVVMHSATKFLAGHHDVTAGLLVGSQDFIARARDSAIRLGPSLAAFDAWLAVRGIKTLALRMERTCSNAMKIARFLEGHSGIRKAYYPGLETHPQHEIVRRMMGGNGGGMLSFDIKGDMRTADRFVKGLAMIRFAPSFGGLTTTITHPAKTSHRSLTVAQRSEVGITDTLIRLSVGIEDADDIIADLDRALENWQRKPEGNISEM
jgi:cystathionine beta-lyase/cystathionine gamma-synthase